MAVIGEVLITFGGAIQAVRQKMITLVKRYFNFICFLLIFDCADLHSYSISFGIQVVKIAQETLTQGNLKYSSISIDHEPNERNKTSRPEVILEPLPKFSLRTRLENSFIKFKVKPEIHPRSSIERANAVKAKKVKTNREQQILHHPQAAFNAKREARGVGALEYVTSAEPCSQNITEKVGRTEVNLTREDARGQLVRQPAAYREVFVELVCGEDFTKKGFASAAENAVFIRVVGQHIPTVGSVRASHREFETTAVTAVGVLEVG
jgi:hypothetical protein